MIFKKRIERSYVSELDDFLFQIDQNNIKKSTSTLAEISKSKRVSHMRDDATYDSNLKNLWENF